MGMPKKARIQTATLPGVAAGSSICQKHLVYRTDEAHAPTVELHRSGHRQLKSARAFMNWFVAFFFGSPDRKRPHGHGSRNDRPGSTCKDDADLFRTSDPAERGPETAGTRNALLQTALRRPLTKLMIRTTNPTTSSKWIRLPPTCRLKPSKPQNQKNNQNRPKHTNLLRLIREHPTVNPIQRPRENCRGNEQVEKGTVPPLEHTESAE